MDWIREETEGRDAQHWAQAEQELDAASGGRGAAVSPSDVLEGSQTDRKAEELKPGKDARRK